MAVGVGVRVALPASGAAWTSVRPTPIRTINSITAQAVLTAAIRVDFFRWNIKDLLFEWNMRYPRHRSCVPDRDTDITGRTPPRVILLVGLPDQKERRDLLDELKLNLKVLELRQVSLVLGEHLVDHAADLGQGEHRRRERVVADGLVEHAGRRSARP